MKLIAGLGNPGKEYEKTRHNSGFMVMDILAGKLGVSISTRKFNALVCKVNVNGENVLLMKPMTYMNESGLAVSEAASFYHIEPVDILIIHDDMDLAAGNVRIRKNGSAGGQKGMKSVIDALHTSNIPRIRIGVGHSERGNHEIVPDWVLSPVAKSEQNIYRTALEDGADAAYDWISDTMDNVMNRYNIKVKSETKE